MKILLIPIFFLTHIYANNTPNFDFLNYTKSNKYSNVNLQNIDIYTLSYISKKQTCELKKNNKLIPSVDERFQKRKRNIRSYRCTSWVKEQYSSCRVKKSKSISSVALTYGRFTHTNLLIGINPDYYRADAILKIECKK